MSASVWEPEPYDKIEELDERTKQNIDVAYTPCLKKRPKLWLAITSTHVNGF